MRQVSKWLVILFVAFCGVGCFAILNQVGATEAKKNPNPGKQLKATPGPGLKSKSGLPTSGAEPMAFGSSIVRPIVG